VVCLYRGVAPEGAKERREDPDPTSCSRCERDHDKARSENMTSSDIQEPERAEEQAE
jgi:hypothetical protein